jgi:hypothetical protein
MERTPTLPPGPSRRSALAVLLLPVLAAAGCAAIGPMQPPRVAVVGLEPLAGEGFEMRFTVRLRVQNPNPRELGYDGLSVELDVNGRRLASGVTPARGTIGAWSEAVLAVPVTVSAVAAVRQLLGLVDGVPRGELPYAVRGRFGGNLLGGAAFASEGVLRLSP